MALTAIELELSTQKAQDRVRELEAAIEALKPVFEGPKTAAEQLADDLEQAKQKARQLAQETKEAYKTEQAEIKKTEQARQASEAQAAKERERQINETFQVFTTTQERAKSVFLQAIGGEEFPERIGKVKDAFSAAADNSQSFGTRVMGLIGAVGLGGQSLQRFADIAWMTARSMEENRRVTALVGDLYGQFSNSTLGIVDRQTALAAAQTAWNAQLNPTGEQLERITLASQRFADVLGGDAASATQRLVQNIASGNQEELRKLGIHLSEGAKGAQALHEALGQLDTGGLTPRTFSQNISELGTRIKLFTGSLFDSIAGNDAYADSIRRSRDALIEAQHAIEARAIAEQKAREQINQTLTNQKEHHQQVTSQQLADDRQLLASLGEQVQGWRHARPEGEELVRLLSQFGNTALQVGDQVMTGNEAATAASNAYSRQQSVVISLGEALRGTADAQQLLSIAQRDGENSADRLTRVMGNLDVLARASIRQARERRQYAIEAARDLRRDHAGNQEEINAALGGLGFGLPSSGGGGPNPLIQLRRELSDVARQLRDAGRPFEMISESSRKARQSVADFYRTMITEAREALRVQEDINNKLRIAAQIMSEAAAELARQQAIVDEKGLNALRDANEQEYLRNREDTAAKAEQAQQQQLEQKRIQDAMAETQDYGRQFQSTFAQIADANQTGAQAMASTFAGAFNTMTGAMRTHVRAMLEGKEDIGEALKAMAHEVLLSLATESIVQTIFQTAQGLAALATGAYPKAAGHFAAAGMFAVVATAAGIGAAATAPAQTAASATNAASNAANFGTPSSKNDNGNGGTTYNIVFQGDVYDTREAAQDAIGRHLGGYIRRGGNLQFAGQ